MGVPTKIVKEKISIHALREEGDFSGLYSLINGL